MVTDEAEEAHTEEQSLGLPSDFSVVQLRELELSPLAIIEVKLRVGRAYDLLAAVRQSVKHEGAFIIEKNTEARGVKDKTRAEAMVRQARMQSQRLAERYNENRGRLLRLLEELPQNRRIQSERAASTHLGWIDVKKDLSSRVLTKPRQLGDSRFTGSWIFTVGAKTAQGVSEEAVWSTEGQSSTMLRPET